MADLKQRVDTGLMAEIIEDALHLAHDQEQIEESEYQEALGFVRGGFEQNA